MTACSSVFVQCRLHRHGAPLSVARRDASRRVSRVGDVGSAGARPSIKACGSIQIVRCARRHILVNRFGEILAWR